MKFYFVWLLTFAFTSSKKHTKNFSSKNDEKHFQDALLEENSVADVEKPLAINQREAFLRTLPLRYTFASKQYEKNGDKNVLNKQNSLQQGTVIQRGNTKTNLNDKSNRVTLRTEKDFENVKSFVDVLLGPDFSLKPFLQEYADTLVGHRSRALVGNKRIIIADPKLNEQQLDKDDTPNNDEFRLLETENQPKSENITKEYVITKALYDAITKIAAVAKGDKTIKLKAMRKEKTNRQKITPHKTMRRKHHKKKTVTLSNRNTNNYSKKEFHLKKSLPTDLKAKENQEKTNLKHKFKTLPSVGKIPNIRKSPSARKTSNSGKMLTVQKLPKMRKTTSKSILPSISSKDMLKRAGKTHLFQNSKGSNLKGKKNFKTKIKEKNKKINKHFKQMSNLTSARQSSKVNEEALRSKESPLIGSLNPNMLTAPHQIEASTFTRRFRELIENSSRIDKKTPQKNKSELKMNAFENAKQGEIVKQLNSNRENITISTESTPEIKKLDDQALDVLYDADSKVISPITNKPIVPEPVPTVELIEKTKNQSNIYGGLETASTEIITGDGSSFVPITLAKSPVLQRNGLQNQTSTERDDELAKAFKSQTLTLERLSESRLLNPDITKSLNKSSSSHIQRSDSAQRNKSIVVGEDNNDLHPCTEEDNHIEGNLTTGVKEINELTKNSFSTGCESKKDVNSTETFSSGIDLEYLQTLFNGKDIESFQENYTRALKKETFENIRNKLSNSLSAFLKNFENAGTDTEMLMRKIVEDKLKQEESSIRYQIDFPNFYHAVGTITLPFDNLVEPFEAWYAGELNMSRIDYYYGMDKSYQRGDIGPHGVVVKLVPAHWGKHTDLNKNKISCWYKQESIWTKRRAQTVVPMNVKKFKLVGKDLFNGVPAYKFFYQKKFVSKNNTYILHVSQSVPHVPLRYEMIGYDHLLRSHYDHYIIDYLSFKPWKFDYKILQIPKQYKCYKKLRQMKSHFEANPMWDFLHGEEPKHRERELTQTFKDFKDKHSKEYKDHVENHKRKNIFRHNTRFIHSHNRANRNYSLGVNHLADLSDNEFEMLKGQPMLNTPQFKKEVNEIPALRLEIPKAPLPKNLDWRDYGAVSPVHSQSFCASCWAFSAVGAIEGAYTIYNGTLKEMAVQQLVDCSWGYNNNGCRGGWSWRALNFVGEHGIATRESYGNYIAQEGYCHCGKKDNCDGVKKMSYRTIEKKNAEKLKAALSLYGPGSVAVQCARKTFKFYSSGVYDDPKCSEVTDHAVVIIGYGKENNKPYWLIKNSWGKLWGDNGYMKIDMNNNLCGVLTNGALMVSFNNWKENKNFPFEKMKKTTFHTSNVRKKKETKEKLQFFEVPKHVDAYLHNLEKKNENEVRL